MSLHIEKEIQQKGKFNSLKILAKYLLVMFVVNVIIILLATYIFNESFRENYIEMFFGGFSVGLKDELIRLFLVSLIPALITLILIYFATGAKKISKEFKLVVKIIFILAHYIVLYIIAKGFFIDVTYHFHSLLIK